MFSSKSCCWFSYLLSYVTVHLPLDPCQAVPATSSTPPPKAAPPAPAKAAPVAKPPAASTPAPVAEPPSTRLRAQGHQWRIFNDDEVPKKQKNQMYRWWWFISTIIFLPGTLNNHFFSGCLVNPLNFFNVISWNHPTETTILKWMFPVPGMNELSSFHESIWCVHEVRLRKRDNFWESSTTHSNVRSSHSKQRRKTSSNFDNMLKGKTH